MDALLQRALAGDEDARRDLVQTNAAGLRRYLERRMGSRLRRTASAADLQQEVFLRVFAALPALPADATQRTFRRWLFRHANWVLANHGLAARNEVGESAAAAGAAEAHADSADTSTGDVTRADQVSWLHALLDRLEPKYREVVRMRAAGQSFAAIAARLGVEEATVRQRFSRVVRALQARRVDPGTAP